ncbi:SMP-30/gluconolactonase/LRE family protein [Ramlibacter sp.]|uniref:SMP-30/gluconolactonase/LRE family protein n=1 Tax=Ramlibacter sp. TaxID=1917967 RepID=UPI003D0AD261
MTNAKFEVVAEGLRFPEGPIAMPDGTLLLVEIERQTLTRIDRDGRADVVAYVGGGPNGAAIGPDGHCYICNNGGFAWHEDEHGLRPTHQPADYSGGRIERVDLKTGRVEVLYTKGPNAPLKGPNDIVFDGHGGFWFTDLGKARTNEVDRGRVYYAKCDGSRIEEAVYPMLFPNGIALSPDDRRLYVAETDAGRVWAFDIESPGRIAKKPWPSPNGGELLIGLPGYQRLDSMAVEASGNVCVATLMENAGVTVIAPDGKLVEQVLMPDRATTNICFGGPDLRTAFVTLSLSGRLVAVDWPRPGLPLHHLNRD